MGLANAKDAMAIFARSQHTVYTQAIKHGTNSATCGSGTAIAYDWWYAGDVSDEPVSSTLIGFDATNCIAYYHLTGGTVNGIIRSAASGCCGSPIPGFPSTPVVSIDASIAGTTQGIALNDGGSDASPYDGSKHYNYTGYPVCAAFRAPSGDDYAFAAGSAASLSVTDAASACATGSLNMCAGDCDNIDIVINVN